MIDIHQKHISCEKILEGRVLDKTAVKGNLFI